MEAEGLVIGYCMYNLFIRFFQHKNLKSRLLICVFAHLHLLPLEGEDFY